MSGTRTSDRAPSIRDVALAAGVSYQTVSRVLNDHPRIRPSTAERVHAAIGQLGYRPNRAARALVTSRSHTIGVLITARSLHGPFSSFVAIEQAARERGYAISATPNTSEDADGIAWALDGLLSRGVDGIVAIAPQDAARAVIRRIASRVPLIALQGGPDEADSLSVDQQDGARAATRHLIELGHRRILHLPGPEGWAEAAERRKGYLAEMAQHGLDPLLGPAADWTPDGGYAAGRAVLPIDGARRSGDDFSAVFSANDEMAIGFVAAAREAGIRVPQDLSVVGFDDIPTARYATPPLTTVRQDFTGIGRQAIATLIDAIDQVEPAEAAPVRPFELIVRESTAAAHHDLVATRDPGLTAAGGARV
ncbi:LacI family DNA-binding transcriptional regulator [uncultured Amnibacterium sp.]|uniref:LacI family DNA-binding transcriptional regulator n=1 Tax=uncultured Amnibacterium sp. TaxID=1631851 RepID=UPI0035CA7325